MHDEVRDFLARVKKAMPERFRRARVLEIGSFNINGSAREFFEECDYVGCDWRSGPGVDIVGLGHQLDFPDGSFDVVVSTECLEHDPHWRQTLAAMKRMLKPGGLMLVTVAAFDRKPHELDCAPNRHYRNLQPEDLTPFLEDRVIYEENLLIHGIHFACIKRRGFVGSLLGKLGLGPGR